MTVNHAPGDCPVCGEQLHLTRLSCQECGTELAGDFERCEFCALTPADRRLLKLFLGSRGNLKAMERQLGLSYPTVRTRVDSVLARLGVEAREAQPDSRLGVLQALARGEVDLEQASAQLRP
ncbi:MAG TPA: DUF2089 domain-containing protein [Candidatus Dormibacteraeota bacterium]|nr:DUF2089 domain-containing protein [Candidatus Dormibacteraeota bacterium]